MEVAQKKRKGRPSGASRLNEQDRQFLHEFAKIFLDQPQAKFATLCKVLQPDITETDLRRLRSKWKEQKEDILKIEQQKRDANAELSPLGEFIFALYAFDKVLHSKPVQDFFNNINKASDKASDKFRALIAMGLDPMEPHNSADTTTDAAIIEHDNTTTLEQDCSPAKSKKEEIHG